MMEGPDMPPERNIVVVLLWPTSIELNDVSELAHNVFPAFLGRKPIIETLELSQFKSSAGEPRIIIPACA